MSPLTRSIVGHAIAVAFVLVVLASLAVGLYLLAADPTPPHSKPVIDWRRP